MLPSRASSKESMAKSNISEMEWRRLVIPCVSLWAETGHLAAYEGASTSNYSLEIYSLGTQSVSCFCLTLRKKLGHCVHVCVCEKEREKERGESTLKHSKSRQSRVQKQCFLPRLEDGKSSSSTSLACKWGRPGQNKAALNTLIGNQHLALSGGEHFLESEAQGIIIDTFPDPPQRLTQVTSVSKFTAPPVSTRPECGLSSGGALRVTWHFADSLHIWSRHDALVHLAFFLFKRRVFVAFLDQVCLWLVCSSCPTGTCALLCRATLSRARCRSWLGIITTTARSAEGERLVAATFGGCGAAESTTISNISLCGSQGLPSFTSSLCWKQCIPAPEATAA